MWERDYVPVARDGDRGDGGRGDGLGVHLWLFRDVTERRRIEQQVKDAAVVLEFQKRGAGTGQRRTGEGERGPGAGQRPPGGRWRRPMA